MLVWEPMILSLPQPDAAPPLQTFRLIFSFIYLGPRHVDCICSSFVTSAYKTEPLFGKQVAPAWAVVSWLDVVADCRPHSGTCIVLRAPFPSPESPELRCWRSRTQAHGDSRPGSSPWSRSSWSSVQWGRSLGFQELAKLWRVADLGNVLLGGHLRVPSELLRHLLDRHLTHGIHRVCVLPCRLQILTAICRPCSLAHCAESHWSAWWDPGSPQRIVPWRHAHAGKRRSGKSSGHPCPRNIRTSSWCQAWVERSESPPADDLHRTHQAIQPRLVEDQFAAQSADLTVTLYKVSSTRLKGLIYRHAESLAELFECAARVRRRGRGPAGQEALNRLVLHGPALPLDQLVLVFQAL